FSTGSDNVMQLAIWAFGKPGTYALAPSPGFLGYEIFARSFGLEILPMPLPNGLWDLDRWRNEARREDVSLVILTTPNNPTGTAFTHDELVDFLEFVPKHVTVILDMAYVEFDPNSPPDTEMLLELHENVICCRTFSKAYGLAGLRLGYGIAAEHHINDMKKLRTPYAANGASLAAALAAMNDEVHLHRSIDLARDGVEWWTENLTKLGVEVLPSSANFVMARVPEAPQIFDLMLDEGVIVRHLRAFRLEDGLRITCGLTEENEIALDAFKKALNTLRGVGQGL
ncbi:aminotransferase class I/II-fold pyridoxal phosphate-dependent enzyme, partial [bacterium]|nr:aminotransferase class I/II-fold pyridoxal phosphate-dependent enzyme [bacterium]